MPHSDVARTFGERFAERLFDLEQGRWQGPVASGYGLHFVRVSERAQGGLPQLDAVRPAVRREWMHARRLEAEQRLYRTLRERYEIVVEAPPAVGAAREEPYRSSSMRRVLMLLLAVAGLAARIRRAGARSAAGLSGAAADRARHLRSPVQGAGARRGIPARALRQPAGGHAGRRRAARAVRRRRLRRAAHDPPRRRTHRALDRDRGTVVDLHRRAGAGPGSDRDHADGAADADQDRLSRSRPCREQARSPSPICGSASSTSSAASIISCSFLRWSSWCGTGAGSPSR